MADQLSSGTGDFDADELLEHLPKKLKLQDSKAQTTVQNQAKDRKRTTLVQVGTFGTGLKASSATTSCACADASVCVGTCTDTGPHGCRLRGDPHLATTALPWLDPAVCDVHRLSHICAKGSLARWRPA